MDFKHAFGTQLKIMRKSKKFSQEQLAEMVGIHVQQISKIESGSHFPTAGTLEGICIAFNIVPKDLFDFTFDALESHYAATGTGTVYNFKATVKNNIVYLHDAQNESVQMQKISAQKIEDDMFIVAANSKRSIVVKYFLEDGKSQTIEYMPDKTYKILEDSGDSNTKETQDLLGKVKDLIKDEQCFDFVKLAVDILKTGEGTDKMENLIAGIKLASKKR